MLINIVGVEDGDTLRQFVDTVQAKNRLASFHRPSSAFCAAFSRLRCPYNGHRSCTIFWRHFQAVVAPHFDRVLSEVDDLGLFVLFGAQSR